MFKALLGRDIAALLSRIKNGQDIDAIGSNGASAIVLAAGIGFEDGVKTLIEHGADIDFKDRDGKTALVFAAVGNHQGCLRRLIEAGANLNIQCNDGRTALMSAAAVNPGVIEFMVKAGADPDLGDKFGYTAAMFALGAGNQQGVINLAMSGADLEVKNIHGFSLLDLASAPRFSPSWQNLISGLILAAREKEEIREHIGAECLADSAGSDAAKRL